MPKRAPAAFIIGLLVAAPAAQADVKLLSTFVHTGICEASGAVAFPQGSFGDRFLVANDDDNVIRLYAADRDGGVLPLGKADLNPFLGLDPKDDDQRADLEGAAWLDGVVFWIGSQSRSAKGKIRRARHQFFATSVTTGSDGAVTLEPRGTSSKALPAAIVELDPLLDRAIQLDREVTPELAAKKGGLDVEGLAARPDGKSLLIGLRGPLASDGSALVLTLHNPTAVIDKGAEPRLGRAVPIDLGGRGVRAIAYSPADNVYLLVAGPSGDTGTFDLFRWSGVDGEQASPVKGAAEALASIGDFQPEAMLVSADGRRVQLLSDDGRRPMPSGKTCKEEDPAARSFRSVVVGLE